MLERLLLQTGVSRIFGARNYMVVDHAERLPEKLPILYAGLTREDDR